MTMKKIKQWLAAALAIIMICGMLPAQAFAVDTSATEGDTCVCSEACTADKWNVSCPVCSTDFSKCAASGCGNGEDGTQMPSKEAPVEDIVKQGENGLLQMYVTLLDKYGSVLATTNPARGSSSWSSRTINFGDTVTIQMEFGALKEAVLEDGIDEDVCYYLDLPMELVPVKVDAEGNKLVDPETPVELFNSGTIKAQGGIYSIVEGEKTTYRLKFHFTNTADQVDIAANFQYCATLNDDLNPESVYSQVDFGGAGKVSITTGKKDGETPTCNYQMSISGVWNDTNTTSISYGARDTKINWTVSITDHTGETEEDAVGTPSLGTTLRISTSTTGKHGFISTMSNYVSTSPFQIEVTETDGTQITLTARFSGTKWLFYQGEPSDTNGYIASIDLADYELGSLSSNSFIAKTVLVTFGNSDGSAVTGIKSWNISFSSWVYDNVGIGGNGYVLMGELAGVRSDGSELLAGYGLSRTYNVMDLSNVRGFDYTGATNAFKYYSFGSTAYYVPEYYKTSFTVLQEGCHSGNYFTFHYYPHTAANGTAYDVFGRANYYVCGDAGRAGPLVDTNDYNGLFNYIKIDGSTISWTDDCFNQENSSSCTVGKMAADLLGSSYNDPALAYQIKKVFTSDSTTIRVFRSTSPASDGKYYYVVLSPEFVSNARSYPAYTFSGYSKPSSITSVYGYGNTYTRQPGDWMIYVFNTAGLDVDFQFTERLGDFNRIPVISGGSVTNKLELYNGYASPYYVTGWGNGYSAIDTISSQYVTASKTVNGETVSNEWIQWTGEFDFSGYAGKFNDRFSRIYVKVPSEVSFMNDGFYTADGSNTGCLLLQTSSGWTTIGGTPTRTNNSNDWNASGLEQESGYVLYYWNYASLVHNGNNLDSNGKVHLRFFTLANSLVKANTYSAGVISCELALQLFSGDLTQKTDDYGSSGSNSLLTFSSHVKGSCVQPQTIKTVSTAGWLNEDGQKVTRLVWNVDSYLVRSNSYGTADYFNGTWRFSDSMKASTVTREDGTAIDINPGKFTTLLCGNTNFYFSVNAGSASFTFSKEDLDAAIAASDHKVTKTVRCSDPLGSYYDFTATLTYSGDMETGFDLQLDGLKNCAHIHLTYFTLLDDLAFSTAIDPDDLTQLYQLDLKNNAMGGWIQNATVASAEYKTKVVAALAVKKTATNIMNSVVPPTSQTAAKLNPWENGWDGKSTRYTVTATVGASPTEYLRVTDYLSHYLERENWLDGAASTTYEAPENLSALAECMNVKNITITIQDPYLGSSPKVIYENGAFKTGWTGSTLTMRSDLDDSVKEQFPGALYQLVLKQDPDSKGEPVHIGAGSTITITYDSTLEMDTEIANGVTFRQSDYYNGGVLEIVNNVSAARTYTTPAIEPLGGNVVGVELICDAGSGAVGAYLVDKKIGKTYTSQVTEDGKQTYHFLIAERTEQSGKDAPVVEISDVISTFNSETNLKKLMEQGHSEAESRELLAKLDALLLKYTTVSNLSIYYNEENPALTTEKDHLCYAQEGPICEVSGEEIADGKVLDVTTNSETAGYLFTVKLSNMGYGEVVVVDYDLEINWRDFLNEAERLGLLTNGMMFGAVTPVTTVHNSVYEAEEGYVSSSENNVEISSMTAGKKVLSNDSTNGKTQWQVDVNTGYNNVGSSLTISDTVTPTAKVEAIAQAVGKALSVTNVKLVLQGVDPLTIYENGALTEAAQAAGWRKENLSVTVDGLTVTVVISDTDALQVLMPEQSYRMTYETVLDKGLYASALAEAGLKLTEATYTLENTVQTQRGSFSASAESSATQTPVIPVSLTKSGQTSEKETTSVIWTVTGSTGDADRKDFVIRDIILDKYNSFLSYLSIQWMSISLTTGDGSPVEIFNNRDGQSVNRLAEFGAKLEAISALNGETEGDLVFAVDGKYGFSLSFEALKKDTVVTVTYKTAVNVGAYETEWSSISTSFRNGASLTTADGSSSSTDSSASVYYTRLMNKTGSKSGKTDSGNDILKWTIPLNLCTKFTLEELNNAQNVSFVDDLHPGLAYVFGSLKVYQREFNGNSFVLGDLLPADAYQMELSGNRLTIRLLKPAEYPAVQIEFQTEVRASVAGLTNVAYLNVDGKSFRQESSPLSSVTAVGQTGYISSLRAPEWTPQLYKKLDGNDTMDAGTFSFTLTEVTQDGTPIEGGYSETVTNNENGEIPFSVIRYTIVENGDIHYYKITENDCTGYQKETAEYMVQVLITRLTDSFQLSVTSMTETEGDPFTFYNSTLVEIKGQKVWDDKENQDGKRPDHVTVYLYADGQEIDHLDVTAGEDGNWNWSFGNLPRTAFGKTIQYSVLEKAVEGYTTQIDGNAEAGFTITNSYTPSKTGLTVTKFWADGDNQDGIRPTEITVKLLANGEDTGKTLILKADQNWTGSFTDLDEYAAGVKIVYTVEEVAVDDYTATVVYDTEKASANITNVHEPAKIDISGEKVWNDGNDQDGIRPEWIIVKLLKDGKPFASTVATKDGNWKWSFLDLDKFADGQPIAYTIIEEAVEGYTATIDGNTEDGFTITNTHTPSKTGLTVTKIWVDEADRDGIRPTEITVKLLANGKDTGKTLILKAGENWTGSFTDLDEYAAGVKIVYTVEEVAVAGYTAEITGNAEDGFTITNTHTHIEPPLPVSVEISAEKTLDGKAPTEDRFTFVLTDKEGNILQTVKNAAGKITFSSLQFSEAGTYVYTLTEQAGGESGIVYDTTVYTVTITVTKEGNDLVAVVTYQKDGKPYTGTPCFANTTKQISDMPQTGDGSSLGLGTCLAMLSALGFAVTLLAGKKRYRGKYTGK